MTDFRPLSLFFRTVSLWASSLGRSGGGAGKGRRTCNYVSGIWISLHRESRSEILIEGNDISNDVITLGACFHVFFNVCLHSRSFPLRADWPKSDSSINGEPQGNWRWNSNSRGVVTSSRSFSRPAARAPRSACSVYLKSCGEWVRNPFHGGASPYGPLL